EPTQPPSGERLVSVSYERNFVSEQNFGALQRTVANRPTVVAGAEEIGPPSLVTPNTPPVVSPGQTPSSQNAPSVRPHPPIIPPGRKEARLDTEAPSERLSNLCFGSLSAVAALWWGFAASGRDQKRLLVQTGQGCHNAA